LQVVIVNTREGSVEGLNKLLEVIADVKRLWQRARSDRPRVPDVG